MERTKLEVGLKGQSSGSLGSRTAGRNGVEGLGKTRGKVLKKRELYRVLDNGSEVEDQRSQRVREDGEETGRKRCNERFQGTGAQEAGVCVVDRGEADGGVRAYERSGGQALGSELPAGLGPEGWERRS